MIKNFKIFEVINRSDIDPYGEENWDNEEILVIYLYRKDPGFGFHVRKGRMVVEREGGHEDGMYHARRVVFYGERGRMFESYHVINIENVDEQIELSDRMRSNTDTIVLPLNTSEEDVRKILTRVHKRLYNIMKTDMEKTIKNLQNRIEELSDVDKVTDMKI